MIHVLEHRTRDEWLNARAKLPTFGASILPSLFGANPFYSAFAAIADRISGNDSRESDRMSWGLDVEEPIAKRLAREHGLAIVSKPYTIHRNDAYPHLHASPDFLVTNGGDRISNLQIKNVGRRTAPHWDDGLPDYVNIQVQGELAAEGLTHSYIGAQIAGDPPVIFEVTANARFQEAIRKITDDFWVYVEERRLPEIDDEIAIASTQAALRALHPEDNGETVGLGPEYEALWLTMELAKKERDRALATIDFLDAQFRAGIGAATYGRTALGRWSLKTTARKAYEVKETTYRTLRKVRS